VLAVDTGDGVLVFDTGIHEACCGPDPAAHFGSMLKLFEIRCPRTLVDERLRQAGYCGRRCAVGRQLAPPLRSRRAQRGFPAATDRACRELEWAWSMSTKPSGVLPGDLDELGGDPWDYDDTFDLRPASAWCRPRHTPGHQALLVSFDDGRSSCAPATPPHAAGRPRAPPHRSPGERRSLRRACIC
jgi:hypothetical protein